MSFVRDALRKSVPESVAPSRGSRCGSRWMERCRTAPWLTVLAVLAAATAGAAAQRWTRHAEAAAAVQPVVLERAPAVAVAAPAEMAPLVASRSLDKSASRLAPSQRAPGSTATSGALPQTAAYAEVPVALPKQLPQPVVTGYVLGTGADSLAIIDGKVLRVGEEAAPGLRIEKIDTNGVMFSYQGHHFRR